MREKDLFENQSVIKAVLKLAIPSVLGQLILVIYNMADTFFVGLSGQDAMLTSVTVCMPAFMFLTAISNLFGVGGSSVISRALGKGDSERAKSAFAFSVWGCLITSFVYCLFTLLFADKFIDILGGSNALVHDQAKIYLLISVVICGVPTVLNTLFSHLIRSEGKSLHASLGIVVGGLLNMVLDPIFMFVIMKDNMIAGAALATGLSNVIALVYYIVVFICLKNQLLFSLDVKDILNNKVALSVLKIGMPACLMTLCENISYAILDNLMQGVTLSAQAGVGVAKKVNMFAHSIVRGMAQGVLPLIAYNKASGNRKRMKHVVYTSGAISFIIALLAMAVSLIWARPLINIFITGSNSDSLEYGVKFLRIFALGAPLSAIAYTVISFFQAVGCAYRSLILALLRKGIVDIPLMYILKGIVPVYGIVMATPIADAICCLIALYLFNVYLKYHGQNKAEFEAKRLENEHAMVK